MRAAIVDDLAVDREYLAGFLIRWSEETNTPISLEERESGEALLQTFTPGTYDIIFLDVILGGMDGMKTARQIRAVDENCRLVFTTCSSEFAVDSYEVAAAWYLVKPYQYGQLKRALNRCGLAVQEEYITIPGRYGPEKLFLSQIAWTEYENRRIRIHFLDGSETWALMNQGKFVSLLMMHQGFCDCMKGLMVHFTAVEKLLPDSFLLRDGSRIPISRLKYRAVREQFLHYSYEQAKISL